MKYIYIVILAIIYMAVNSVAIQCQPQKEAEIASKLPKMLNTSNAGTKFYVTVPPPYEEVSGDNYIRFFIISSTKNKIKISNKLGFSMEKEIEANKLTNIDLEPNIAFLYRHGSDDFVRPAFTQKGKAIIIESDEPVVVFVILRFRYTSDGFLALPVSGLGSEYIAQTIGPAWDKFPTWISAVGVYDDTKLTLSLGGTIMGDSKLKVEGGGEIIAGQRYNFDLNEGDVWLGGVDKKFGDLSGTKITANKPFAFVNAQFCNQIPIGTTACDYSIEMPYPSHTWGKTYHIPPIRYRRFSGFINIVAKEANTNVFRDGRYLTTIRLPGGGNDAQGGYHYDRLWQKEDYPLSKPAVITADKPIHITYFNPGSGDDGVQTDPFWMTITPAEQFSNEIVFCTPNAPGGDRFNQNFINVVFELNENEPIPNDMEWITYEGSNPRWLSFADYATNEICQFYSNNDDEKKYGCSFLQLPAEGVFGIRSKTTKFTIYAFGEASWDSYGYPTATGLKDLTKNDNTPPTASWEVDCDGNIPLGVGKVVDGPSDPSERTNFAKMGLISELSFNYRFLSSNYIVGQTESVDWGLEVINELEDAEATVYFMDRAGNYSTYQFSNSHLNLKTELETLNNTTHNVKLSNVGTKFIIIYKAALEFNDNIQLSSNIQYPYALVPGASIDFKIEYESESDIIETNKLILEVAKQDNLSCRVERIFPLNKESMNIDLEAPELTYVQNCNGDVDFERSFVKDMPDPDEKGIRSNLASMELVQTQSFNYKFIGGDIIPGETISTNWGLEVIDKNKDAKAVINFADNQGNITTEVVNYTSIKLSISISNVNKFYGSTGYCIIKNTTGENYTINKISLKNNEKSFLANLPQMPMIIVPNAEFVILIELKESKQFDTDNALVFEFEENKLLGCQPTMEFPFSILDPNSVENEIKEIGGIFPNPNNGTFTINCDLNFADSYTLKVNDIEGRVVADGFELISKAGIQTFDVNIPNLSKGVYILSLSNGKESFTGKIVVE